MLEEMVRTLHTAQYSAQYYTVHYTQHSAVQYSTVQYSTGVRKRREEKRVMIVIAVRTVRTDPSVQVSMSSPFHTKLCIVPCNT
jgi:hypothetical protein